MKNSNKFGKILIYSSRFKLYIVIALLFILNFGQTTFFYYQNQQLQKRVSQLESDQEKTSSDLSHTKTTVTNLSQYFEGKGNLTIGALLETVNQLQQDENQMKSTIDTMNNNVSIANKNQAITQTEINNLSCPYPYIYTGGHCVNYYYLRGY